MKKTLLSGTCLALMMALAACGKSSGDGNEPEPQPPTPPTPPTPTKIAINISPSFARATDTGFETGDRIGLFVVNYNGSTAGTLLNSGNHVDNMRFTYSGVWTPDTPIYWIDDATHADFYMYYPYGQVSSVGEYQFNVAADQSAESAYKASDMLWGAVKNVSPTSTAVSIPASHVMSRVNINVAAGNGFTPESLAASDIAVKINGLKTVAKINLANGAVTPVGAESAVTPLRTSHTDFRAIVVPQSVAETSLIVATVDGKDYTLKKAFTFESGKSHNFTIVLTKTSNGVNVTINPWTEDGTDNGGTAE